MTTTPVESRSRPVLVGAASVVAVAAAVVIVVWGLVPLPSFPALSADPDPSVEGVIAALETDHDDGTTCVQTIAASGTALTTLTCYDERDTRWPEAVGWTDDGHVVVTVFGERGPEFDVVDRRTGDVVSTGMLDEMDGGPRPFPGERMLPDDVRVRTEGGRLVVSATGPSGPVDVLDVAAPRSYEVREAAWSPDDRWLALVDSEQRLLIASADGQQPVRLLLQSVRAPAWWSQSHGAADPVELPAVAP